MHHWNTIVIWYQLQCEDWIDVYLTKIDTVLFFQSVVSKPYLDNLELYILYLNEFVSSNKEIMTYQ